MFETDPKTQCKECLLYPSQDIVCCTCRHLLTETVSNRSFIIFTLDLPSIAEYVIKKGRPHCHRNGEAPEYKEYYLINKLKKGMRKRDFSELHDRFFRDHVFRERMLENKRDPIGCQNHNSLITYKIDGSPSKSQETLQNQCSEFKQALTTSNRVHREAGRRQLRPTSC